MTTKDDRIDKRKVTMVSVVAVEQDDPDHPGGRRILTMRQEATDYVRPDFLDAYLADARTRWQLVTVSEEPDAGPAGYHGATHVPETLNHPLAGQTFAATRPSKKES